MPGSETRQRRHQVGVRLTEAEHKKLTAYAKSVKMSIPEVLRTVTLDFVNADTTWDRSL